ncbi:MAG TPA: cell division protein FtsQ/DivIB [Allosphingosinicella sp.]|uniref:cell division protein FtsQ/DivIB n=1 Tax=Allosphingosinicella sp. TaxID=2823234 RepID=UPI002ED8FE09
MSARIARGTSSRARPRASSSRGRTTKRRKDPGLLDALPFPAETVRRVSWWIFLGMLIAVALAVASALRVPQMVGTAIGENIGRAGFAVERVEIKGAKQVPRLAIYNIAWDQPSTAMPLVDLDLTRERLLRFGWVKEARVSRRWPDTLVVDIVERQPAAIWQHNQQLALIDAEGVVLDQVKLDAMPDLPLVIGPAANRHANEFAKLTEAAPQLKPMVEGATWVGGRRWDIRFQSGEVLALPEGEEASKKALIQFARMDQSAQLLGRGLVRFDMRIPGKFIVRVSREPGSTVPDIDLAPSTPVPDAPRTI